MTTMYKGGTLESSYGAEVAPSSDPEVVPGSGFSSQVEADGLAGHHSPDTSAKEAGGDRQNKICGLPKPWFWALVGITVIIIAAALGIGLDLGLSQSKSDSSNSDSGNIAETSSGGSTPSATSTKSEPSTESELSTSTESESPSSTSSAPVTSGTSGVAANSCTFDNPKTYNAKNGKQFRQYCFKDWPTGTVAADGDGRVQDIAFITVYTFEDCMESCIDYNGELEESDTKCAGVTYNANLTSSFDGGQDGNCFLKDKIGDSIEASAEVASAVLLS